MIICNHDILYDFCKQNLMLCCWLGPQSLAYFSYNYQVFKRQSNSYVFGGLDFKFNLNKMVVSLCWFHLVITQEQASDFRMEPHVVKRIIICGEIWDAIAQVSYI
jgi:hypothetical protein